MKKVALHNLGCKVNSYEIDVMQQMLQKNNYEIVDFEQKADIYIVNIDGDNLTQLTKNKSFDMEPYWTTDGYLYFTSDRGNKKGNYQIWRFKLDD